MKKRFTHTTQGSTLTWVMVVSIVLVLLIGTMLTIITYNAHTTQLDTRETQAYYTALTVNERIVTWLSDTPAPGTLDESANNADVIEAYRFIEDLIEKKTIVQSYTEDELGSSMGTATTTLEYLTNTEGEYINITTAAEFANSKETLTTTLYLKKVSEFNSVNTGFDYSDPSISSVLEEINEIPTWASQTKLTDQYASGSWWTYFLVRSNETSIVDYRMDLLSITQGDIGSNGPKHDYSYKYLQNAGFSGTQGKDLVRINLDPSRGPFYITQTSGSQIPDVGSSTNPIVEYPFPYNNLELRPSAKGILLTVSAVGGSGVTYKVGHKKIVYYTKDFEGSTEDHWSNITLGTYYGGGTTPPKDGEPLAYQNLSLYFTDTSEKTFEINSGINITSGTMYTKRSTTIGTVFDDTGQSSANRQNLINYSKRNDLVFETYNFVFANPGDGESQRHSRMQGAGVSAGDGVSKTIMNNGSILVQANHELTIGSGAVINAQANKGIVIEPGGSLVIEGNTQITGNIYVSNGATLTINGNAQITGNIFCSGTLNINSSFELYALNNNQDNIDLGYISTNAEHGNCTGIFIYNDTTIGVGTLNIASGCSVLSPTGPPNQSNLIHTFIPYPDYPSSLFCNHKDPDSNTNLCAEWDTGSKVWAEVPGSIQQVNE